MSSSVTEVPSNASVTVDAVTVGVSGALAFSPIVGRTMTYLRYLNSSGSGTISFTRSSQIGTAVAVNGPGTVNLGPGEFEEWIAPGPVLTNPIYAVGSAAGLNLTVEWA